MTSDYPQKCTEIWEKNIETICWISKKEIQLLPRRRHYPVSARFFTDMLPFLTGGLPILCQNDQLGRSVNFLYLRCYFIYKNTPFNFCFWSFFLFKGDSLVCNPCPNNSDKLQYYVNISKTKSQRALHCAPNCTYFMYSEPRFTNTLCWHVRIVMKYMSIFA